MTATISVIPDLIAMGQEISLGNYEIEILLKLYNAVFLNKLLFNCQSWSKLTKNDQRHLEMKQLELLKHIMEVPHTTSNIGVSLELGLLPVEHLINQRRLVYLHRILKLPENDPVLQVYQEQKRFHFERNWANEIIELRDRYSLIHTEDQIRSMTKHQWKSIVDKHINKFVH